MTPGSSLRILLVYLYQRMDRIARRHPQYSDTIRITITALIIHLLVVVVFVVVLVHHAGRDACPRIVLGKCLGLAAAARARRSRSASGFPVQSSNAREQPRGQRKSSHDLSRMRGGPVGDALRRWQTRRRKWQWRRWRWIREGARRRR